jgi:glutaredoxin
MEPTAKRIVVYSKAGCPFCSLLKNELSKRGFAYEEYDLTDDSIRSDFYANAGVDKVPQLFVTDQNTTITQPSGSRLGGWSDVSKNWQAIESLR